MEVVASQQLLTKHCRGQRCEMRFDGASKSPCALLVTHTHTHTHTHSRAITLAKAR